MISVGSPQANSSPPGCPAPPPRHHRRRNQRSSGSSTSAGHHYSAWTEHRRSSSPLRVDWAPPDVDTAFLEACRSADEPKLRNLLRRGVTSSEINKQDRTGRTGLSYVCMNGNTNLLEMIIDLPELDVNLSDNEGTTPLMYAAQAGHSDAVMLLLDRWKRVINVDQRNCFGMTALMKAALQGRRKCCQMLLGAGANPVLVDPGRRFCALQWAQLCSRESCANMLDKYMKAKGKRLPPPPPATGATTNYPPMRCFSEPDLFPDGSQSPAHQASDASTGASSSWLKSKLKKPFTGRSPAYSVYANLGSTVVCASSAILQNGGGGTDDATSTRSTPCVVPKVIVTPGGEDSTSMYR